MFNEFSERKLEVLETINACVDFAEYRKMPEKAKSIKQWIEKIEKMRYEIAIIGFMKRGKSTLLNTLLGRSDTLLAPVRSTVCTAVITKYLDRSLHPENKDTAIVFFLDGEMLEIPHKELDLYINQKHNESNSKGVKYIEVYGDFPLVKSSVTIVDTPGRGSIHKEHDILGDEFLPYADAIILPIAADLPIDADEREFLNRLADKEKRRIFVVLTKVDLTDEKELMESEQFLREQLKELGITCGRIYRTAALPVLEGKKNGAEEPELTELRRRWGIEELERDLERDIRKNSNQEEIFRKYLSSIAKDVASFAANEKKKIEECLMLFDSDISTLAIQKKEHEQMLVVFNETYKKNKNIFISKSKKEINKYLYSLEVLKDKVVNRFSEEIEKKDFLSLLSESKKISSKIKAIVVAETTRPTQELEEKLDELFQELFVNIESDTELNVYFKRKATDRDLKKENEKILGGVAISSAGIIGTAAYNTVAIPIEHYFYALGKLGVSDAAAKAALKSAIAANLGILLTAAALLYGVKKLAEIKQKSVLIDQIPKIVEENFGLLVTNIQNQLSFKVEEIIDSMSEQANEQAATFKQQLKAIEESIAKNDPTLKSSMQKDLLLVNELNQKCIALGNRINII